MKRNLFVCLMALCALSASAQYGYERIPDRQRTYGGRTPAQIAGYHQRPTYKSSSRYDSQSQVYQGFRGGLSLSSYSYTGGHYSSYGDDDLGTSVGFHFGYIIGAKVYNGLFLESGLYFGNKGYKYDEDQYVEKLRTYNFDIPINIGYRFDLTNQAYVDIKCGPYITYALFGTYKQETWAISGGSYWQKTSSTSQDLEDIDDFQRFGAGLNVGAGIGVDRFYLGFNFQWGLTKLFNHEKYYEQNCMISLGVNL